VKGGIEAIREKFGVTVEGIPESELLERWQNVAEEKINSVVEKWENEAKRVIEPKQADLKVVARLYLAIWDLLNELNAQGLTMAYGDATVKILPVPCVAYMNLRDEGIPAACEADIISLLMMTILHYLTDKPSFMGNTFVDLGNNAIMLSHCVAPRKMAGYEVAPASYVLRDQHWGHFLGSVSAFVEMEPNQEVTICRLSGDLDTMLVSKGVIMDSRDLEGYCRITVRIKIDAPVKNFIQKTSGNHHVMVYGDCLEELSELNKLLGITTIEV
jgi:L-fucose isomerase-like protein